jgi:hypothetical protein
LEVSDIVCIFAKEKIVDYEIDKERSLETPKKCIG